MQLGDAESIVRCVSLLCSDKKLKNFKFSLCPQPLSLHTVPKMDISGLTRFQPMRQKNWFALTSFGKIQSFEAPVHVVQPLVRSASLNHAQNFVASIYLRVINKKDLFCPQIKLRAEHHCVIILAHRSLPVRAASLFTLQTFGAQIN